VESGSRLLCLFEALLLTTTECNEGYEEEKEDKLFYNLSQDNKRKSVYSSNYRSVTIGEHRHQRQEGDLVDDDHLLPL
jgi:hypothetical protein